MTETLMTAGGPVIMRKLGLVDPIDDGPGKPISIQLHIGQNLFPFLSPMGYCFRTRPRLSLFSEGQHGHAERSEASRRPSALALWNPGPVS
jgi:hypothetical protein